MEKNNSKLRWTYFPNTRKIDNHLLDVVRVFEDNFEAIDSQMQNAEKGNAMDSNTVLSIISEQLKDAGYEVEKGKRKEDKIHIPVLYGENGIAEKSFDADAYSCENKTVIEVEAGRAVANYQFLKDFFEASVMDDVDYLCIAVRQYYAVKSNSVGKFTISKDYEEVCKFFNTMYLSRKYTPSLKGILIIGY